MARTLKQVFDANPTSAMINTDLMYVCRSPFSAADDFAITWANMLTSTYQLINIPTTSSSSVGVIQQNSSRLIHTFGSNNLFVGNGAGNFTLGGANRNVGFGTGVLSSLIDGATGNNCFGHQCGKSLTNGSFNVFMGDFTATDATTANSCLGIGVGCLRELTSGEFLTAIGPNGAGDNYTNERNNIVLDNEGQVGDSHVMRLGTFGSGDGQVNTSYIAGNTTLTSIQNTPIGSTTPSTGVFTSVVATALGTQSWRPIGTNAYTGATYTFALTDQDMFVQFNRATAQTVTVPSNASVAFPIGTEIDVIQIGAGQVTFAAAGGVTLNSKSGSLALSTQWSAASLKKVGTNTWDLVGDFSSTVLSGPASSTDHAIARFDGVAGNLLENSSVLIDDSNNITGVVNLTVTGNVNIPTTSSSAGIINQNSLPFIHTFGTGNTFIGDQAGNFTLTTGSARFNTVIGGTSPLSSLTTGASNTGIGASTLQVVTSGSNNNALGISTLAALSTGNRNIAIGNAAGSNYVSSESDNILIASLGAAAESNVMRLGTFGSGANQVNTSYIAGNTTLTSVQNTPIGSTTPNSGAFTTLSATGLSTLSAGQIVEVSQVTGATYTALTSDFVLACNRAGTIAITLIASPATGRMYRIKDISGAAATNNITITPAAGNIDGAASYVINTNFGSIDIVYTGAAWSIL